MAARAAGIVLVCRRLSHPPGPLPVPDSGRHLDRVRQWTQGEGGVSSDPLTRSVRAATRHAVVVGIETYGPHAVGSFLLASVGLVFAVVAVALLGSPPWV